MENIHKIYTNDIGISFKWAHINSDLIQVIFRDTGFHLNKDEIVTFLEKIADAKMQNPCPSCKNREYCRSILLQTISDKISMAVSSSELNQIEDLLKGTLFQLHLNDYLSDVCKN